MDDTMLPMTMQQQLCYLLRNITENDTNYPLRATLIYRALYMARLCGLAAGVRFDADEPDWPVAFIELPTGQVSWHLEQHATPWDGHTTPQKMIRIRAYLAWWNGQRGQCDHAGRAEG